MNRELIRDYFQKSGFSQMQADALEKILSDLVTRDDLARLEANLSWRIFGATAFLATVMTLLDAFVD